MGGLSILFTDTVSFELQIDFLPSLAISCLLITYLPIPSFEIGRGHSILDRGDRCRPGDIASTSQHYAPPFLLFEAVCRRTPIMTFMTYSHIPALPYMTFTTSIRPPYMILLVSLFIVNGVWHLVTPITRDHPSLPLDHLTFCSHYMLFSNPFSKPRACSQCTIPEIRLDCGLYSGMGGRGQDRVGHEVQVKIYNKKLTSSPW